MQIKLTVENDDQSLKIWVDSVSGALCLENDNQVMEIPNATANELIKSVQEKLYQHHLKNKKWYQ